MGSHHDIDRLFPAIEGQDPRAVAALYDRMLARVFKSGHSGATFGGIGTLDMALWDLKAKLVGEPLWRLLGARDRFVGGYASGPDIALDFDQLATWYRTMGERGFTSGKLKGGRDMDGDIRRLGIVAEALSGKGATPAVTLDANDSWNLKQVVRYVTAIEISLVSNSSPRSSIAARSTSGRLGPCGA